MTNRNRAWADQVFDQVVTSATPHVRDLLANAPTIDTITAVRIVGDLIGDFNSTVNPQAAQVIDIGIGVSSAEALAIGVTALPSPVLADEYPPRGWLYVARKVCTGKFTDTTGLIRNPAVFSFDLRAMRKIDKGRLFMVMHNTNSDGADTAVSLRGRVRVLCLT